jgi:alkylation response protein AidB-like acyl-CoA dehydrogenase
MDLDVIAGVPAQPPRQPALVMAVRRLVPRMSETAAELDREAAFPHDIIAELAACGALAAPFPARIGGLGLGTEASGVACLTDVLRQLGRGNMAVGRLYEAHVNAVRLLVAFGTSAQIERAFADAQQNMLFGLWVTDANDDPLRAGADGLLDGRKSFCSGAGNIGRAIATVRDHSGETRLAYLCTETAAALPATLHLQGMRAATTGAISFVGQRITEDDWIGEPGDYLKEPLFSAGAWRTSAVTCGGLESLVGATLVQLKLRGRATDPHQQERFGRLWIAQQTAQFWLERAALVTEANPDGAEGAEIVATVNFARIAIETACLDALTLVQRSLGLGAFIAGTPVERIMRDLATYLRQPAPDEALTEAAAHIIDTRTEWGP